MNSVQTKDIAHRIRDAVSGGRFSVALAELETLAKTTSSPWKITSEIAGLRENFGLVKRFALDGFPDPSRGEMLDTISSGILRTLDIICRENESEANPSSYYSSLRYERMQHDDATSLKDNYISLLNRFSMSRYGFSVPDKSGGVSLRELNEAENRLFARFWTTFPFDSSDVAAFRQLIDSEVVARQTKEMLIGALYLGGSQFFDAARLELLADFYAGEYPQEIAMESLCALLLLLWQWRNVSLSQKLSARLTLLADDPDKAAEIRMAFLQFIRTIDTTRVTREVNEEIIPKVRDLSPDLKKLSELQETAADSLEENPQWQDLLRDSGLQDQLKRLNDMQLEGADVMMSTFSHLKNFPFFNTVANWFRPFDTDVPDFADSPHELLELLRQSPFLCDSDKYSMAFSLSRLAPQMLGMVKEQLAAQNIDLAEVMSHSTVDKERNTIATHYLQNLYRFFNLFRRKGDFYNPFVSNIDLFEISQLTVALDDTDMKAAVAEFYLKNGYYKEALLALGRIPEDEIFFSNDLLQKVGFCCQKLGDYAGAIDAYSKSELLDGRNTWTLRRLAYCHKALGNVNEALAYFNRLLEQRPDDIRLILNAAHCHMEAGDYSEAMNLYFKVEYLDDHTTKALRPIAWCAFLMGDLERARVYYDRVLLDSPTATDYLNYGHFLLADGRAREAANAYSTYLEMSGNDVDKFRKSVDADASYLERFNVDPLVIQLVIDEVEANIWK